MKLVFLGTCGYIKPRTEKHQKQSALKVSYYNTKVIVDCGEDWSQEVQNWEVDAILVTHAHPDHAFGLKNGAPCPVYATKESWEKMSNYPIRDKRIMPEREIQIIPPNKEHPLHIEAFPVSHSTRAPAVGYRIQAGEVTIFYVPDVAWIKDREDAMKGIDLYIGDGASLKRSMVRKPGDTIVGHVPIQTQLTWCQKMGVGKAVFTHLGKKIVEGNQQVIQQKINEMVKERDLVEAKIAVDKMKVILR